MNDSTISLEVIHDLLFDMLCAVDDLCRTNDIEYWVDAGTVLGAVRHGDFLPWDDDVDICMTRPNMALFRAMNEHLPTTMRLLVRQGGRGPTAKVVMPEIHATEEFAQRHALHGESVEALALDIMEVVSVGPSVLHRGQFSLGKALALQPIAAQMTQSPQRLGARRISWYTLRAIPSVIIGPLQRFIDSMQRDNGLQWAYSLNGAHPLVRWERTDIWPLSTVSLRGRRFPAPHDLDAYLTALYGPDYLTPPPPEDRLAHFTEFHRAGR